MSTLFIATKNAGKMVELRDLFRGTGFEPQTYAGYADIEEGETSYEENAALKARALRAQLLVDGVATAVLGDDSGIEVLALDGRPGVLSARYAGPTATWDERRGALVAELDATGSRERDARFVCVLHFIDVNGDERSVRGEVDGTIVARRRGEGGFGYDPIFQPTGHDRTFAEFPEPEKNRMSHRGRAVAAFLATLSKSASIRERPAGTP